MQSHIIHKPKEIVEKSIDDAVVGIDETQFFEDEPVQVCKTLASRGKRVIVAGLDTDYRIPFGPMHKIMCEADYLDKLQAICVVCGNPASYTQRTSLDSDQVVIGRLDKYEARCKIVIKLQKIFNDAINRFIRNHCSARNSIFIF